MNNNKSVQCQFCNRFFIAEVCIHFSICKHYICLHCIINSILSSNFDFIKKEFVLICKCKNDSITFTNDKLLQMCNLYQINKNKFIEESSSLCKCNKEKNSFFCKTCSISICEQCRNYHNTHIVISLTDLRKNIKMHFQKNKYMTYDIFLDALTKLRYKYSETIRTIKEEINYNYHKILQLINKSKQKVEANINEEVDKINKTFVLLEKVYNVYYNDYSMSEDNNKISHLTYLLNVNYEITDIDLHFSTYSIKSIEDLLNKQTSLQSIQSSLTFEYKQYTLLNILHNSISDCFSIIQLSNGQIALGCLNAVIIQYINNDTNEVKVKKMNGVITSICEIDPSTIAVINSKENKIIYINIDSLKTIKIYQNNTYDKEKPKQLSCLLKHKDKLLCGGDNDIFIIDINTLTLDHIIHQAHNERISCFYISENYLFSGGCDSIIKIWNLSNESKIECKGHSNTISSLLINNNVLISGSYDCTVRLWSISSGKCLKVFQGNEDKILSLMLLPSGMIAVGTYKAVDIWDFKKGKIFQTLECFKGYVNTMLLLDDGRLITGANEIIIWI